MSQTTRNPMLKPLCRAAVSVIMLALCACGGGSGPGLVTTPPPQPAPPQPEAAAVSAPESATMGSGAEPVLASPDGPTFRWDGGAEGSTFPLLQTAMVMESSGIRPDTRINTEGGTLTVIDSYNSVIDVGGFSDVSNESHYAQLDWTRIGWWAFSVQEGPWDYGGDAAEHGAFVAGYQTPAGAVPTTGSATYQGFATGFMLAPSTTPSGYPCACGELVLYGDATFTADFGARSVNGNLVLGYYLGDGEQYQPWNRVAFTSTIAGTSFSGTTSVTNAPEGAMAINATGTIEGRFFGPSAQEAGAVWTLFDGTRAAIGSLAGRQN